jgi:hypothetical protein
MPVSLARWSAGEIVTLCLLTILLFLAAGWGISVWLRSRVSAEELERRRRAALHSTGKMGDATLLELRGNLVFYSYEVRGVEYTASQDVSGLASLLPSDPGAVNGLVYVKYDPRNAANSIILCEEWSGFRHVGSLSPRAH